MDPLITNYVMPGIGCIIILVCLLSFFSSFGDKFKDKTQKIKGFGIDLEVSVLSLFILVGVALSFAGIYLNVMNYESLGGAGGRTI